MKKKEKKTTLACSYLEYCLLFILALYSGLLCIGKGRAKSLLSKVEVTSRRSYIAVMASSPFALYLEFESSSMNGESSQLPLIPNIPEKALPRIYHSVPQAPPDTIELDNLQWDAKLTGPPESGTVTLSGVEIPVVPEDLEMSRPVTPNQESDGFEALQSIMNPPMNRFRMLAVCMISFCTGLNDSAPGALIPYIESYVEHFCII